MQHLLSQATIDRLDAELLLAHALSQPREWLITNASNEVDDDAAVVYAHLVARRSAGEPVSYITGVKEFYGRPFQVTPATLIPRPATEHLVEVALRTLASGEDEIREADTDIVAASKCFGDGTDVRTIVDIGTGSGCIAITLKLEKPDLRVIGTDISGDALEVAKENARRLNADVAFWEGSLLDPIAHIAEPFVIVSNPPYIPADEDVQHSVAAFEPQRALFSGDDGMDVLKPLWSLAKQHTLCRAICLECKSSQWLELTKC